jgi:hypothetical protein
MKTGLGLIPRLLCLAVVLTTSVVVTHRAAAAADDSEHVAFNEPVMVGGTMLEAETYKLVWEGTGPTVQVSFMQGSKTVATATATLVIEKSSYNGAIETKTSSNNSRVLEKITWKKKALVFGQSS